MRKDLQLLETAQPSVALSMETTAIEVPSGDLFGYPTRLVETWAPKVEHLLLKGYTVPVGAFTVRQAGDEMPSFWHQEASRLPRLYWRLKNRLRDIHHGARADPVVVPDGYVYDARWMPNKNMAHILIEIAPRALLARELLTRSGKNAQIHVVANAGLPAWVKRSFALLGLEVIYTNGRVRGGVLEIDCDDTTGLLPSLYKSRFPGYTRDTPARVFLSRRNSRHLLNEQEVWSCLQKQGFERLYFEDMPVELQWSIGRNAREIVAVHGAAMSTIVFNACWRRSDKDDVPPKLVELFTPGWMPSLYRQIAAGRGLRWAGVRGQIMPEVLRDLDHRQGMETKYEVAPFRIALASLEAAMTSVGMR